jgi:hypothetical protein
MFDLLPDEKVVVLRARLKALKRATNSYTVWEMFDPPLKSEEEIKKIKENEKAEIETITKILKENTKKKREQTRLKNQRARMQEK